MSNIWIAERIELFKKLAQEGKDAWEIGELFNLQSQTIRKAAERFGILVRKKIIKNAWMPEKVARLREMVEEGNSSSIIGKELGFSRNAVISKCHLLKLQLKQVRVKPRHPNSNLGKPIQPKPVSAPTKVWVHPPTAPTEVPAPVVAHKRQKKPSQFSNFGTFDFSNGAPLSDRRALYAMLEQAAFNTLEQQRAMEVKEREGV